MLSKARRLLKQCIPPILSPVLRRSYNRTKEALTGASNEMKYVQEGWAYAQSHPDLKGYNVADWIETCKKSRLSYMELASKTDPLIPFSQDPTSEDALVDHNRMMLLGYCLMIALRNRDSLSILDWGGALGHLYYVAKALLPQDVKVDFTCKDVPLVAQYGREHVPEIDFSDDETCLDRSYDIVMAHASLYYSQNWREIFAGLARASKGHVLISRVPFVTHTESYVILERLYRFDYNVEALCWALNRESFLDEAQANGLNLVREFITGQAYEIPGAPEQPVFRGFLFSKTPGDYLS